MKKSFISFSNRHLIAEIVSRQSNEKALRLAARPAITSSMPRYISQHTIACLTRQALQAVVAGLKRDETVTIVRCVSDSLEGKLLCEFEAPDKETVVAFLSVHNMRPQRVMRVENEW
jgi:hypothetical protein